MIGWQTFCPSITHPVASEFLIFTAKQPGSVFSLLEQYLPGSMEARESAFEFEAESTFFKPFR